VIFYNILARATGSYKAMVADCAALVSRHLSRDLDLGNTRGAMPQMTQDKVTVVADPVQAAA
jgi:hypothetical protein